MRQHRRWRFGVAVGLAAGTLHCAPHKTNAPTPPEEREKPPETGSGRVNYCAPGKPNLESGKEILYDFLDEGDPASADLILQNIWPVSHFQPAQLPAELTWTEN